MVPGCVLRTSTFVSPRQGRRWIRLLLLGLLPSERSTRAGRRPTHDGGSSSLTPRAGRARPSTPHARKPDSRWRPFAISGLVTILPSARRADDRPARRQEWW